MPRNYTGAILRQNWEKHGERPSALDFIPHQYHEAVWNDSIGADLSGYLQHMVNSVPEGARAVFRFPRGKYKADSTVNLGTRRVCVLLEGAEIVSSASLFSVTGSSAHDAEDGGSFTIRGSGPFASKLTYTGASGAFIDFNRVVKGGISGVTVATTEAGNTAQGIRLFSTDKIEIRDVNIEGFDICLQTTGPGGNDAAYSRTNTTHVDRVVMRNWLSHAIDLSYTEEITFSNVQAYVPTTAAHDGKYAMRIGTGVFAVYGQTVSLMGGGVLIYWVPSNDIQELPPNWLFFDNLLTDMPWGTPALKIDSSLMSYWNATLPGRGYRFSNCWFAAADVLNPSETDENDTPSANVYVAGGHDIEFVNCKIRSGKGHGIHLVNALGDVRFSNCAVYGTWFNNPGPSYSQNGAALYIDAACGEVNVNVTGGQYSAGGSDVGGHGAYGIYNASASVHLVLQGADLSGNEIAPMGGLLGDQPAIWNCFWGDEAYALESGVAVSDAQPTNPMQVTTATPHGVATGEGVWIVGMRGMTPSGGGFMATVTGATTLTLDGVAGAGTYVSGGQLWRTTKPITGATNADPIEITCVGHGLNSNDRVRIALVGGNTAANGDWFITVTGADTFTIPVAGSGAYTSGGTAGKLNSSIQYNRLFGANRVRVELGDSNFYLDMGVFGSDPHVAFDNGDFLRFFRPYNQWHWTVGNNDVLRLVPGADDKSLAIYSRPTEAAAFTNPLLNSALDADAAERFNLRGDGRMSWGDGTAADAALERIAGGLSITGKLGIGLTPTAHLHLPAGTAAAGTAPLKFTAGVNLGAVENGALEFDGTNLFITAGGVRYTISILGGALDLTVNDVNIGAKASANNVGSWLIGRAVTAGGGYRVGLGLNVRFDGTNWVTEGDGSSNGGTAVLTNYSDAAVEIYTIPSTGGADQTISTAALASYLRAKILSNGRILINRASEDVSGAQVQIDGGINANDGGYNVKAAGVDTTLGDGSLSRTSGDLTLTPGAGGYLVLNGPKINGAGAGAVISSAAGVLSVESALAIARGGTGGTDAATARSNLDVYAKGDVYTKAEVDALLAGKSDTTHNHDSSYAATSHSHSTTSAGAHTHGGAVAADGDHSHGVT